LDGSKELTVGVNLRLESENGSRLAELLDPRGYAMYLVSLSTERQTVCLRFIDPYGDTVFNALQARVLIDELEGTRPSITDASIARLAQQHFGPTWQADMSQRALSAQAITHHLEAMLSLARRCVDEVHTYLKFYGD
jgi:hypothetical protein